MLADTSIDVILGMLFFTLFNTHIRFATTRKVELVDRREFEAMALDKKARSPLPFPPNVQSKAGETGDLESLY